MLPYRVSSMHGSSGSFLNRHVILIMQYTCMHACMLYLYIYIGVQGFIWFNHFEEERGLTSHLDSPKGGVGVVGDISPPARSAETSNAATYWVH